MGKYGERTAVVLDEQPLWLEALEQLLESIGMRVLGKATDAEDMLALVAVEQPEVLVIGFGRGDEANDVTACLRRAQELHPDIKTIVMSPTDQPEHIDSAFAAGASAFCVKTADPSDVAAAVRQVFDKSIYLAHSARTPTARDVVAAVPAETPDLTRRELEILQLVAEGHSNAQLARMLWVTEQTVKFHLSNIYRKLGVANRTEASRWAQLHGLLSHPVSETAA
jgi:DNA-binding NarL/FixJ family response regulator